MDKVRFGIIGFGKQGSYYARLLTRGRWQVPGAVLGAVCDVDEKRRDSARSGLPGSVSVFGDYREMFESGLIDAVLVVTPHYQHPLITTEAFEAGLHVLCDKPAGVYTGQVRQMNEAADRHPELVFGLMLNQRTDPLYRRAKDIIGSGLLGNLKRIIWIVTDWYRPQAYYDQGGWRGTWSGEGGGVLINQVPHQLDLFTWLAGSPVSVRSTARTVGRRIPVENDVTAVCTFENGADGVFIASTHDHPGTNRLEISGDGGRIVIEKGVLTFARNHVPEPEFSDSSGTFMGKIRTRTVRYRGVGAYLNYLRQPLQHAGILRDFTNRLRGRNESLIAPGRDGITGLAFSNAIHLSSWLGREVTLPLDEDLFFSELEARMKGTRSGSAGEEAAR